MMHLHGKVATKVLIAVLLLGLIGMIVQLLPLIGDVVEHAADEDSIVTQIHKIGWRGAPALVALSALEVIIPFIPAPAVGVLTGLSFGVLWGSLIFLSGIALGNIFVLVLMREFRSLISHRKKISEKPKSELKEKLGKIKKPEIVAFFLAIFPFVSGVGPYLFAEVNVKIHRYVVATVLGNIPSTIVYVILGDRISNGDYTSTIIIGAIAVIAIILAVIFRKKLINMAFETSK